MEHLDHHAVRVQGARPSEPIFVPRRVGDGKGREGGNRSLSDGACDVTVAFINIITFADINNIASGGLAGAITGGLFLREFVPEKTAWVHLDIAGPMFRDKDWKYYEAGAIGFGVKTLVDLCERFHDPVS